MNTDSTSPTNRLPTANASTSSTPSSTVDANIANFSAEILEQLQREHGHKEIYVIYSRRHNSVAYDRAIRRPVCSPHQAIVENYLRRIKNFNPKDDGVVISATSALALYLKNTKKS